MRHVYKALWWWRDTRFGWDLVCNYICCMRVAEPSETALMLGEGGLTSKEARG